MVSQGVDVGGSFGANWLATYGNKNIYSNATGLWSWGQIPLGNIIQGGKLVSTGNSGDTVLINPAFSNGNPNPLIGNKSLNSAQFSPHGMTAADLASPYLSEDPWALAQSIGQPILDTEYSQRPATETTLSGLGSGFAKSLNDTKTTKVDLQNN